MRHLYRLTEPIQRDLVLAAPLRQTLTDHRQQIDGRTHEAGGILLGRLYPDRVVIETASTPGPGDESGPYFFHRSAPRAQQLIDEAWHRTGGELNYLGEWHSHPEARPSPSHRDRTMIREVFQGARIHTGYLLLVIVGTHENWIGIQNGCKLIKLP